MKMLVYSAQNYEKPYFEQANQAYGFDIDCTEASLDPLHTRLSEGYEAVCLFVNDQADAAVLKALQQYGVRYILLRCAGFDRIDLDTAHQLGLPVARVPAYSPYAVAEHAVALLLTLNRKTHKAYNRTRDGNFKLDHLTGIDLHGKTVGVIGAGEIGQAFIRIMHGFGCHILVYDPYCDARQLGAKGTLTDFTTLLRKADILSLHCPLTEETHYLLGDQALQTLKPGAVVINTARGAVIDTQAAVKAIKSGHLGALGIDVYEAEAPLFFQDHSGKIIQDDCFERLLSFPNVLVTGHQGFLTEQALSNIASTTLYNLHQLIRNQSCPNCL